MVKGENTLPRSESTAGLKSRTGADEAVGRALACKGGYRVGSSSAGDEYSDI